MLYSQVMDLIEQPGRFIWTGKQAPRYDMICVPELYEGDKGFRADPNLHQTANIVFLVEQDLGNVKQWPIVLDEAIRLLQPNGVLCIRFTETHLLSRFALANYVQIWSSGQAEIMTETRSSDGHIWLYIKFTHHHLRQASLSSLTFGVITDGRRAPAVKNYIESVLNLFDRADHEIEIIVCGPAGCTDDDFYQTNNVRMLEQPRFFSDRGWITTKKNMIVDAASSENIIVAHDRYRFPRNFISRLEKFGGDFSVVVPRQELSDGSRVPDWLMIGDKLNWATPGWMEDFDYHPNVYVNGGIIIAKTQILRDVRWNELLFWNQAEDVELTRRLQNQGIVPRFAADVLALTEQPRSGFFSGIARLPFQEHFYPQTSRPNWIAAVELGPEAIAPKLPDLYQPGQRIEFGHLDARRDASKKGVIIPQGWSESETGVLWNGRGRPHLSLQINPDLEGGNFRLELECVKRTIPPFSCIVANGTTIESLSSSSAAQLQYAIPSNLITGARALHLEFKDDEEGPFCLRSFLLRVDRKSRVAVELEQTISFAAAQVGCSLLDEGWHAPEAWGVWAGAACASLTFWPTAVLEEDLTLELSIRVFRPNSLDTQIVGLAVNGISITSRIFDGDTDTKKIVATIPSSCLRKEMILSLSGSSYLSPRDTIDSTDGRFLGPGLISMVLRRKQPTLEWNLGRELIFCSGAIGTNCLYEGWHQAENWGVWSGAKRSSWQISFAEELTGDVEVELSLKTISRLSDRKLVIGLSVEGISLCHHVAEPVFSEFVLKARIPAGIVRNTMRFSLESSHLVKPSDIIDSDDGRLLGVGLKSMKVIQA